MSRKSELKFIWNFQSQDSAELIIYGLPPNSRLQIWEKSFASYVPSPAVTRQSVLVL